MVDPLSIEDQWSLAYLAPDANFVRRRIKRCVYCDVIEFLAGWAAEHRWHGQDDPDQESWADDILLGRDWEEREDDEALDDITQAGWSLFTLGMLEPSSYKKSLDRFRHLQRVTHALVAKHWAAIEATAEALIRRRALDHEDVEQIFKMANTGTPWRLVKKRRNLIP